MPKIGAQIIKEEIEDKIQKFYNAEEQKVYASYLEKFELAKTQRNRNYREFDDMNYEMDYQMNLDATNSYLKAKRNDDEVRIVTGVTEKKIEAVENELLAMNLQSNFNAFNQEDKEDSELGHVFTDLVKRTNEIEKDEDFWVEAIQELLTQRAVFIEEILENPRITDKRSNQKTKQRNIKIAKKRLVCGLNVFLGDITIPAHRFNEQPYIICYNRLLYRGAKKIRGDNSNWQYVKPGMSLYDEQSQGMFDYRFGNLKQDEVEVISYYSYPDDEYQVILNGVMMEKIGQKLPWEYEGYNLTMVVLKSMGRKFAYGKPLTASAKTLQALDNETIRNLIRKFRQAIEPPLAVAGRGKIYSRDIFAPASMAYGLKAGEFERLIDHQGVTNGELAMYDLINRKTEEFIGVSNVTQGLTERQQLTATQTIEMQRQAIKMLGFAVLAVMRMKRDADFLRLYNILENYTQSTGKEFDPLTNAVKDAYRRFTANDAEFENQQTGQKEIVFMNRDLEAQEEQQIFDFEEEQIKLGQPTRIVTVNVEKLRQIPYIWQNIVQQTEKEGTSLQRLMFTDKLNQAVSISQITGRPLNSDKIIDSFERIWKVKDMFLATPPAQQLSNEGQPQSPIVNEAKDLMSQIEGLGQTQLGAEAQAGVKSQIRKPGLDQVVASA